MMPSPLPLYDNAPGPVPSGPTPPRSKRLPVRDEEAWAVTTLRREHDSSLYQWGEYNLYILLWGVRDFEAGLVDRCPTCYTAYGKIAEAYGQTAKEKCDDCFGTTFEGGYRAKIVRPTLWTDTDEVDNDEERRGAHVTSRGSIQSTSDFVLRERDIVVRPDGSRWQAQGTDGQSVATGFHSKNDYVALAGLDATTVIRQDVAAVAYSIPPLTDDAIAILDQHFVRTPQETWVDEEIVGPLW